MPIEKMSADEFREYVDSTIERDDYDNEYMLIDNAKNWYQKSRHAEIPDKEKELYRKEYVKRLIEYGFRAKGRWDDSGVVALDSFQKALKLDSNLPIAHYRIGHIFYKQKKYARAVAEFEIALEMSRDDVKYGLDDIQQANARTVMAYCALKVFENVRGSLDENRNYPELDDHIKTYTEQLLSEIRPVVVETFSEKGLESENVTYDRYLEIKDEAENNSSFLFFDLYIQPNCVGFNSAECELTRDSVPLFRQLIHGENIDMNEHIRTRGANSENIRNSFTIKLSRMKNRLYRLGLSRDQFDIVVPGGAQPYIQTSLTLIFFRRIEE